MKQMKELLEELDILSQIMDDLGRQYSNPTFHGLSIKVDELIEKYNGNQDTKPTDSHKDDTGC